MAAAVQYGSLPFKEQIGFFRQKLNLGTRAWTDIWEEQHDHAFVVAGAMKAELLADLRGAVDGVITEGATLEQFRKDFDSIVEQHGWEYKGGRGWRTRVIYETNLRTSYMAGRYAQLTDPDAIAAMPYWEYKHSDLVKEPREEHLAWDGLVLAAVDSWWDTHFPPNGWGCGCTVIPRSERDLEKSGKAGPDDAPPINYETRTVGARGPTPRTVEVPEGIDPGWAYTPGKSWIQGATPAQLDDLLPAAGAAGNVAAELPAARVAPASRVLADGLSERNYVNAFLSEFGVAAGERSTIFEDVTGELLVINDALFTAKDGSTKVLKRGRAPYVLLLADTIKLPDEIWLDWAEFGNKTILRRRYVARWSIKGSSVPALVVFETGPQGWIGVTALTPDETKYLEQHGRRGELVWQRGE